MKIFIYIFIIYNILLISSCSRDDSLTNLNEANGLSNNSQFNRTILIEKFTGHTCAYCPQANKIIKDLNSIHGNQIITISLHSGPYSVPESSPFNNDFRTTTGDELNSYFPAPFYPTGSVNRVEYDGDIVMSINKWESATNELINLPPDANITFTSNFDATSRKVTIAGEVEFLTDQQGKFNICVYILENDIIAPQKNNDPNIGPSPIWYDYVHNHMLRTPDQFGTWGFEITATGGTTGDKFNFSSNATLAADWNEANIEIVAFLINKDTDEVVQAEVMDM